MTSIEASSAEQQRYCSDEYEHSHQPDGCNGGEWQTARAHDHQRQAVLEDFFVPGVAELQDAESQSDRVNGVLQERLHACEEHYDQIVRDCEQPPLEDDLDS